MYLPRKTSKKRLSEAEQARQNRAEAIKAWSSGKISRRDLVKMGLMTAAGSWAFVNGLSPYAPSAYAAGTSIPTRAPPSGSDARAGALRHIDGPLRGQVPRVQDRA